MFLFKAKQGGEEDIITMILCKAGLKKKSTVTLNGHDKKSKEKVAHRRENYVKKRKQDPNRTFSFAKQATFTLPLPKKKNYIFTQEKII